MEGLRGSEWGGEDCPIVLGMQIEENFEWDFGAGSVIPPFLLPWYGAGRSLIMRR